jgi:hypothetical protein
MINQHKFHASLYELNIDGMSEYLVLNTLQQIIMATNAYITQTVPQIKLSHPDIAAALKFFLERKRTDI